MGTVLHFRALLLGFLVILTLTLVSVACTSDDSPVLPATAEPTEAPTATTETTVAPTPKPTPTPEKTTYKDARGYTLPLLDTEVIEDGIIALINERRRSLGLKELVRDSALDDLALANSTVNSTNRARAGTFTKNHPESDCETFIQVFRHPQVRRYGSQSLRPTEYYETEAVAGESIASESILFPEDSDEAMEVGDDDEYIGIGITEARNERGWIEFHGTVYTIDCKYEESHSNAPVSTPAATATTESTATPSMTPIPTPTLETTPMPTAAPTPTPSPTPTPTPTPTPEPEIQLPNSTNGVWLRRAYPSLAQRVSSFPWVADGLSEAEERAVDELLHVAANDLDTFRLVIDLPWLQNSGDSLVYAALTKIKGIAYDNGPASRALVAQPFLQTLENNDVLALAAASKLGNKGLLGRLTGHPTFQDGLIDAETIRVAAAGTFYRAPDAIESVLNPNESLEIFETSTPFTPALGISIFRFGTQSRPGTVDAIRDAVVFVEDVMQGPLPTSHVVVVFSDDAVISGFAGANHGFALGYSPDYEAASGTWEQRQLQAGMVHEVAHYFWTGNEDWIDEGAANMFEMMYGVNHGLSRGQLRPDRDDCEAHDLSMLSSWYELEGSDDGASDCDYYLGQLAFEELFDSVGRDEFQERLRTLYQLTVEEQEQDRLPSVGVLRQVFSDQAEVVSRHWSEMMNAPENRPFDEGYEYTSHDLIQWTSYPAYENGVVSFEGAFLNGAEPSFRLPRPRGVSTYANFSLRTADDAEYVGGILEPLSGNRTWTLDDPGDVVADTYRIDNAAQTFAVVFDFPEGLGDSPSDYVVLVLGFQNSDRMPTIGENIDTLGYARIRVP